jgi:uncharacterized membrane protein
MIRMEHLYMLVGAVFAGWALLSLFDRSNRKRIGNALFWGLMAASLLGGSHFTDFGNGLIVLGMVGLAGFGFVGKGHPKTTSDVERKAFAELRGNRLFLPALIIPFVALAGTLLYNHTALGQLGWFEAKRETYVFLVLGVLLALLVIAAWLRPPAIAPLEEGRRLIDAIGWAAVLPQLLAALGVVFAAAGVGGIVGEATQAAIPDGNVFLTVVVYGLGMALFTMIMGNAFAAFPVMATAIGVPLLIQTYGGNPAVVGAIGMLAGFCGTLMTPMAANFNIVLIYVLAFR